MQPVDIRLFFNFRSPYCYLASKTLWEITDKYHVTLLWRPLGGWDGRSPPERAVRKIGSTRQDVSRFARRLGIPFQPPPTTTDPTLAGAGSLFAEAQHKLRPYIVAVMRAEWAEGRDIGDEAVLRNIAETIGLDPDALIAAGHDPANRAALETNWAEAMTVGVIGVPTFVIGDEIFWGQDRIDFVCEHLRELRAARL